MVNRLTTRVENHSGAVQHYALISEVPEVTGNIWHGVYATTRASKNQNAVISVSSQSFAILGISDGSLEHGTQVDIRDDVDFGYTDDDETHDPITTVDVVDGDESLELGA
ncbi:unnamed protein product [Fusarium langsethiae]|nr:unnamed protein product [Fusarium langsethiae]